MEGKCGTLVSCKCGTMMWYAAVLYTLLLSYCCVVQNYDISLNGKMYLLNF